MTFDGLPPLNLRTFLTFRIQGTQHLLGFVSGLEGLGDGILKGTQGGFHRHKFLGSQVNQADILTSGGVDGKVAVLWAVRGLGAENEMEVDVRFHLGRLGNSVTH